MPDTEETSESNVPSYIFTMIDATFTALKATDAYADKDVDQLLAYAKADFLNIIDQVVEDLY